MSEAKLLRRVGSECCVAGRLPERTPLASRVCMPDRESIDALKSMLAEVELPERLAKEKGRHSPKRSDGPLMDSGALRVLGSRWVLLAWHGLEPLTVHLHNQTAGDGSA